MINRNRIIAVILSTCLLMTGLCACSATVNIPADKSATPAPEEEVQPVSDEVPEETETAPADEMTEEDTVARPELESVPFDMNVYGKDGDYKVFESYGNSYLLTDISSRDYPQLAEALKKIDEDEKADYKKTIDANLSDAEEFAKDQQANGDDYSYMSYSETKLATADDKVVSMVRTEYGYLGGAHPDYYYETFNLYTATGEAISMTDIITDNDKLKAVLKDKLNEAYPDGDWLDLDSSLDLFVLDETKKEDGESTYKFTINEKGLMFYFGPYDLNSYADGAQQIEIMYSDLADILKPGFIYEDYATAEEKSTTDAAPSASSKNDLAVSGPGFTGLTNIKNENNDDGSYFYEDMTDDGMTTITNMCAPNSQSKGQDDLAYVTDFVCASVDKDAKIDDIEYDDDLSRLLSETAGNISAYEVEWESGSNEDTKSAKGIVILTDNFTYYYGFKSPIDNYYDNEDLYEDELENISMIKN